MQLFCYTYLSKYFMVEIVFALLSVGFPPASLGLMSCYPPQKYQILETYLRFRDRFQHTQETYPPSATLSFSLEEADSICIFCSHIN